MKRRLNPFALPSLADRPISHAIKDTADTTLGKRVEPLCAQHPGNCGVRLLTFGKDAFAARALLARAAERTLDVQYYIWHDDLSGNLLLDELRSAAARGVRVRLLLDDNGIGGLDEVLAELVTHRNITVRIFNPFKIRSPKAVNFLFDFRRLNRRMHSKSFIVDNQVVIVGGRNTGDEYFDARQDGLFADMDAMVIGSVVEETSHLFDCFWNSRWAFAAQSIVHSTSEDNKQAVRHRAALGSDSVAAHRYRQALQERPIFEALKEGALDLQWAPMRLIADDPEKVAGIGTRGSNMLADLSQMIGQPQEELDLISGYFVPTVAGARRFIDLARQGVTVRVLTNSYAATDVAVVHAGYAPYRKRLLRAGVQLFEMPAPGDQPKRTRKFVRGAAGGSQARAVTGSTLHAKAFAVDRQRLFVGSFNIDPRSANLNTELGVVIESEVLAGRITHIFTDEIAKNSYRLALNDNDDICWIDERDDEPRQEAVEPGTSVLSRAIVNILSHLPIERYL
ncbi:phospholipase D family protein [Croceicoccus sp. F390]|uniref:Phospholipase D n=1 Tax=Croceicoccus esteveae TaxID=3075597 RepID=A0ABU2ZF00_9SPHN|nr:phospholipase D family protein [Croceicoccus sp. F390]MDT0575171.1 phospholipase D family protein [Croceicoccus sp. F390]